MSQRVNKRAASKKTNRGEQRWPKKLRESRSMNLSSDASDSEDGGKGGKCQSRNAIMARMNRIKKKNYIMSLERDASQYKSECDKLKGTVTMQNKVIQTLRNEVMYLKNVLANNEEISLLLNTLKSRTGLPVLSSIQHIKKEPVKFDPIYVNVEPQNNNDSFLKNDANLSSVALPFDEDDGYMMGTTTTSFDLDPSSICDLQSPDDCAVDIKTDVLEMLDSAKQAFNVGVCLHVAQQRVSLEFCSLCNSRSATAWESVST